MDVYALLNIYEIRDTILSLLSTKEVIVICTISGIKLSDNEKYRYYRDSFIGKGVILERYRNNSDSNSRLLRRLSTHSVNATTTTIYSTAILRYAIMSYLFTYAEGYAEVFWEKFNRHNGEHRNVTITITSVSSKSLKINIVQDFIEDNFYGNSFRISCDLHYCNKHSVHNTNCLEYGIRVLEVVLGLLDYSCYTNLAEYINKLYTCSPSTSITSFISARPWETYRLVDNSDMPYPAKMFRDF